MRRRVRDAHQQAGAGGAQQLHRQREQPPLRAVQQQHQQPHLSTHQDTPWLGSHCCKTAQKWTPQALAGRPVLLKLRARWPGHSIPFQGVTCLPQLRQLQPALRRLPLQGPAALALQNAFTGKARRRSVDAEHTFPFAPLRELFFRAAASSRTARDFWGCCHAHSNWSAWIWARPQGTVNWVLRCWHCRPMSAPLIPLRGSHR